MAADMGVISVAEGIEDERTLDQLCEIGIDWGQGYLFSRPSVTPDAPDI
jgi:EAL domain-containing protein (putative c-di-GMP-specific phosphodiesterase class I)